MSSPSTTSTSDIPEVINEIEKLRMDTLHESQQPISLPLQTTYNDDELERFRTQWRQELKVKKAEVDSYGMNVESIIWKEKEQDQAGEPGNHLLWNKEKAPAYTSKSLGMDHAPRPAFEVQDDAPESSWSSVTYPDARITSSGSVEAQQVRKPLTQRERAVQIYAKAVESEQGGQLNEALMLYRKAFKTDNDVDKRYAHSFVKDAIHRDENKTTGRISKSAIPISTDIVSPMAPVEEPYTFQRHIQLHPDYVKSVPPIAVSSQSFRKSPLSSLIQSLPIALDESTFLPEDENLPIPIAKLPAELIDLILSHLNIIWIERFATTCWRARYLTNISMVWRRIAAIIYKEPAMLPSGGVKMNDLVRRHDQEWRTTLIEEERVRMDGCYISLCHYTRPGAGDEWITITHLITYHRFLRFYPDGSAISYLTTNHPSEVVPLLRPKFRGKGLHFGRWRLIRSDDPNNNEADSETRAYTNGAKCTAKVIVSGLLEPGVENSKYEFEMELSLGQSTRGKWNKLTILEYRSINLATRETLALSLKHQKPYHFSKVRSYNPPF
ncbi:uncharacterized protein L203_102857 [Cryptococcus depauperatus CBS 7841]|uniref:F-box domain-containing protein n=1 Tax=Cryptococcus depauperatus CBS 7841 TaxID=1295531 RepID=A0AAJ8JSR5_9TREE